MKDDVSVEVSKVSIPPEVVWGVMVRIVEIDKLLRTGSNIAEVRRPVRKLLNAAATELSGVLMPEFDALVDEVGVGEQSKSSGSPGAV
jgi:hypothetical protein